MTSLLTVAAAAGLFYALRIRHDPESEIRRLWSQRSAFTEPAIPGSISPDGNWKIVQFSFGPSTADICLVLTDRDARRFGGIVPVMEEDFRPDGLFHEGTTLLWSLDSLHFAIHNRSAKHSVVSVLRLDGDAVTALPLHGLDAAYAQITTPAQGTLRSSGHRLNKWTSADMLEITAVLTFQKREETIPLTLQIKDNKAIVQAAAPASSSAGQQP